MPVSMNAPQCKSLGVAPDIRDLGQVRLVHPRPASSGHKVDKVLVLVFAEQKLTRKLRDAAEFPRQWVDVLAARRLVVARPTRRCRSCRVEVEQKGDDFNHKLPGRDVSGLFVGEEKADEREEGVGRAAADGDAANIGSCQRLDTAQQLMEQLIIVLLLSRRPKSSRNQQAACLSRYASFGTHLHSISSTSVSRRSRDR